MENPKATRAACLFLAFWLSGCSGPEPGDGTGGTTSTTGGVAQTTGGSSSATGGTGGSGPAGGSGGAGQCLSATDATGSLLLMAREPNNYSFSSSLEITETAVKPRSELTLDWSGVNADFQLHPVNPTSDVDMVLLVVWNIPFSEVKQKLNNDELGPAFAESGAAFYPMNGETSTSIFQLKVPGTENLVPQDEMLARLDPANFDPALHSYTVMISEGTNPEQGAKMVQGLRLDPTSTNQSVVVTGNSTTLTYDANLTALQPVSIPAGRTDITVDWSELQVNALGRPVVERSINEVMIAHYTQTPAELEEKFLDLELIAAGMWRGLVAAGEKLSLTTLTDASGQPFTGIDGTGTWVLALNCGERCANPAPWYLTILKPCAP